MLVPSAARCILAAASAELGAPRSRAQSLSVLTSDGSQEMRPATGPVNGLPGWGEARGSTRGWIWWPLPLPADRPDTSDPREPYARGIRKVAMHVRVRWPPACLMYAVLSSHTPIDPTSCSNIVVCRDCSGHPGKQCHRWSIVHIIERTYRSMIYKSADAKMRNVGTPFARSGLLRPLPLSRRCTVGVHDPACWHGEEESL